MPTTTPDADFAAAVAAFDKARDVLSKAQEAATTSRTAANLRALEQAQAEYKTAGQAARRAKDPERAHDVLEFQRYVSEKSRIARQRASKPVMGRD